MPVPASARDSAPLARLPSPLATAAAPVAVLCSPLASLSAPSAVARLGVGLVPDYVVQDKVATGEVLTTLHDYRLSIFGTHMYLLYLPNRHQTRAVRTCIDYLLGRALPTQA